MQVEHDRRQTDNGMWFVKINVKLLGAIIGVLTGAWVLLGSYILLPSKVEAGVIEATRNAKRIERLEAELQEIKLTLARIDERVRDVWQQRRGEGAQ